MAGDRGGPGRGAGEPAGERGPAPPAKFLYQATTEESGSAAGDAGESPTRGPGLAGSGAVDLGSLRIAGLPPIGAFAPIPPTDEPASPTQRSVPASPSPGSKRPPGDSLFLTEGPGGVPLARPVSPRDATVELPPPPPRTAKPASETRVIAGRYEVESVLGEGGMGAVYKVFDRQLKRTAALKMILAHKRDAKREARFLHEARAMAKLHHPACVQVYDVGVDQDGAPYLVMELVAGEPLLDLIERGTLTPFRATLIVAQVAGALQVAHEAGIVHRDVKPHNIIVSPKGAKLADFGIAKDDESATKITVEGAAIGTFSYMPPEQTGHGNETVDGRSDIYALGATLYEALVGHPPFDGPRLELIDKILRDEPPSLRKIDPEIPRDLETICLRCLRKRKDDRYASARDLEEDLNRFLSDEPILARKVSVGERLALQLKRHRRSATIGGLAALAVLGGSLGLWGRAVYRERRTARTHLEAGDVAFLASDLVTAESEYAQAARLETPLMREAERRVLRARASRILAEGEREAEEFAKAFEQVRRREQRADELQLISGEGPKTFSASAVKQERAQLLRSVDELRPRALAHEQGAVSAARGALNVLADPEIAARALAILARIYRVEIERDPRSAERIGAESDAIVARFDVPNPLRPPTVEFEGPAGATVVAYRYEYDPGDAVERPHPYAWSTGKTRVTPPAEPEKDFFPLEDDPAARLPLPAGERAVPPGDYLFVVRQPDMFELRVPVALRRAQRAHVPLRLYPLSLLGAEAPRFQLVTAGNARFGEELERIAWANDFFMSRTEVTNSDWHEYWRARGFDPARRPVGDPAGFARWLEKSPHAAVRNVSYDQVQDYLNWFREKKLPPTPDNWRLDLPQAEEFHRALRADFHRLFPWGHYFETTYSASHSPLTILGPGPGGTEVSHFRTDVSCFGITDLCSSATELLSSDATAAVAAIAGGSDFSGAIETTGRLKLFCARDVDGRLGSRAVGFRLVLRRVIR